MQMIEYPFMAEQIQMFGTLYYIMTKMRFLIRKGKP